MLVFSTEVHRGHAPADPHLFAGRLVPPSEVPRRADVILEALSGAALADRRDPTPVDPSLMAEVHTSEYLSFLETAHDRWLQRTGQATGEALPFVRPYLRHPSAPGIDVLAQLGRFSHDADPILAGTWAAAVAAASCAVSAVESALGGAPGAYALTRPPGHHAAPDSFGGYCYLNNVAIGAVAARRRGARVAVLDVDAHAGNGTQAVFWESPNVLTVSVHADPAREYPYFHGFADERGASSGAGYNLNLPLPPGTRWSSYAEALDQACGRLADHGPDLVVVALGVDTATEDGVFALAGDDYRRLGARLADIGRPVAFVQEGGYDLGVLGHNVAAVLDGFAQTT